jgi:hypothetical protein
MVSLANRIVAMGAKSYGMYDRAQSAALRTTPRS